MNKTYIVFLVAVLSLVNVHAQLSNVHYLPPLKQGGNNQAIRQQAFYLSTPETTAFDVNVFQGTNPLAVATLTISNTSPGQYNVADGDNNITLVTNTNTGVVLSNSGLRFESAGGQEFYVNYRGRSNSQATSLTSKGRQAIGTLFKWGGRPNFGNGQSSLNATLGIMATEIGTTTINIYGYGSDCEFRLQGDNDGITDDTLTITLTQGQTYVLEAWRNATIANIDCWLGATIQSDKKIAISNGNLNGAPRVGSNNRDALIDQPVPENVLGREYIFIRGNGVNDTETPIIIGTQNGTDISVAGTVVTTINTGEYYVIDGSNYSPAAVSGNMYVETSKEVYAYQHLSGSSSAFTGGLNFIAPVNCLLPDNLSNISNIRDVDGRNFDGGVTIIAATTTPNANIVVTDDTGVVALSNEQSVNGTPDWKTFYIPGLTGNVSVNSSGPIAVGFLGVSGAAGIAGYFSGFDTVPVVELDVTGGGCLPGADVFEISGNFDAYQWFQNDVEIAGAITSAFTPTEPGDFFVRVTKGTCTYNSAILSVYNCDPEIVISKTVDTSPVIEGDTVTFTVTVESLGVDPVSNLVINDALPSELSFVSGTPTFGAWTAPDWTIGDMFPGEVHTLTIEALVNEVSANVTVTNTINNTQTETEVDALPDDPTEDVVIINNELTITKEDRPPVAPDISYDTVGEVITYDFVVTNTGSQVIPSVTISDPNIDPGSLTPSSVTNLGVGLSANFTATHTITQADIEADQVVNSAIAQGTLANGFVISDVSDDFPNTIANDDDPTITPIEQKGALVLEKIAQPAPDGLYDNMVGGVPAVEAITYEFTVINTGNVSLNNITITDSNIDAGSLTPTSVANLPVGQSTTFTAIHTIVAQDFTNGNVTNSATAFGEEPVEGTVVSDVSDDPTTIAPDDATIVSIPQFGQLEVTKVDDAPINGPYNAVGQTITYTIIATNVGNVPLTNINVVDPNADTITLISTTGTDDGVDNIVDQLDPASISPPSMAQTATFEATHIITQDDLDAAQVVNTATVGGQDPGLGSITDLSDDPDDPTTSVDDPTVVPLVSSPSLVVTKVADDDSNVTEGQTVTYTYIVTNNGDVTFDNVSIADVHSGTGTLTLVLQTTTGIDADNSDNQIDELGPGDIGTWTASYNITAADITSQTDITNTVTATGTPRTGSITNPTADEIVTVNPIETVCGGTTLSHDLTADVNPTIVSFSWSAAANPLVSGETTSNSTATEITDTLLNATTTDQVVVYTIEGSNAGGTVLDSYTYTVTVQPVPTVLNTSRTLDICSGDSLNQNLIGQVDNFNSDVTFTWSAAENVNVTGETTTVSNDDIIQDTLINTSAVSQDIIYTITPTADVNGCDGTIYTITVTVNPLPVAAPITGPTEVCIGSTIDLTEGTTGTIVWSSSDTGVATVDGSGVVTGVSTGTTDITYTVEDANGCVSTSSATYTITVNALPIAAPITGPTEVCIGSTIDLTEGTTGTIIWSSSDTGVATIDGSGVVTGVSAGTTDITYTVEDTNGCVSLPSAGYTVTVNALPIAVPITGPTEVCIGSTIDLTEGTTGTIIWNSSDTGVATIDGSGVVTPVTAGTTDITYTVEDANGCLSTSSAAYTITVNALPIAAPITGPTEVCIGSTIDLTEGTTGTIIWSSSDTGVATIDGSGVVTGVSVGTTDITYTVEDANGCVSTSSATYTITVNALPIAAPITGPTEVCIGSTIELTEGTTGTIVWSSSDTGVATIDGSGVVTPVTAGTTDITYTVEDTNGCVSLPSASYTVTVNALPIAAPITGPTEVCIGSTIDLTEGTTGTIIWSSSDTGVAIIDGSGVVTPVTAGTTDITYTVEDTNGCVSTSSATYTITVNALPIAAPITGPTEVCIGSTIDLTEGTTGTIIWSSSDTGVATIDGSGVVTPVTAGTTDITYTVEDTNGCVSISSAAYTITVNALPIATAITGPTEVCIGSTIDLTEGTTGTIIWSSSDTGVATIDGSGVVTGVSVGTTDITYTVEDANGCVSTSSATYTITVNALPIAAPITGPTEVCIGSTIDLTEGTTGTIVWSSSDTGVATIDGSGVVTGVSAGTTDITYTVEDTNGCVSTSSATYTITVNALPIAAPITGPTEVCIGSTIDLTEGTTGTIVWSSSDTGVATIDGSGVVTPVTAGTTDITYTVEDTNGCVSTSSATYTITVNALPIAAPVTGPTEVCIGSTIDLTEGTTGTIVWSSSDTGVATINGSGVVTPVTAGTADITYTVEDANGCVSTSSAAYTITVNALPIAAPITGPTEVCIGSTIDLTEGTTGTIVWSSSDTGVATIDGSGVVTPVTAGTTDITYTVEDTNSCVSLPSAGYTVTVNALPIATPITGPTEVCIGSTIDLTEGTTGTIVWSSSDTGVATIDGSGVITPVTAGTTDITYTVEDTNGCVSTSSAAYTITVNALPIAAPIIGPTEVCIGSTIDLTEGTTGTIVWSSSDTGVATIAGSGVVTGVSVGTTDITYTVEDVNGCVSLPSAGYTVTINPLPLVISLPIDTICSDIALNHDLTTDIDLTGGTFSWLALDNPNVTGETTTASTATSITDVLINTSGSIQTIVYTITPRSVDGCTGSDYTYTVTVLPRAELIVSKTALPSADGAYDTLGEIVNYEITIQNPNEVDVNNIIITDNNADSISATDIPVLAGNSSITITATHNITQQDLDNGTVTNLLTAEGTDPCGTPVTDTSDDPNTATPNDPTILVLNQISEMSLIKSADVAPDGLWDEVGEVITYTLLLTNTGNVTLTNVSISDNNANVGSVNPNNVAMILPGETVTITASHTITQSDLNTGSVANTASVTAEDPNGQPVSDLSDDPNNPEDIDTNGNGNPDDITITSTPQFASLDIIKTVENRTYTAIGDVLEYTFEITNTSNVTLFDITVDDPMVAFVTPNSIASLSPGASFTVNANYTIVAQDLTNEIVVNTAIANAFLPDRSTSISEDSDDPNDPTNIDLDGDGDFDDPTISFLDTDGDGIPNIEDFDDDNDGITDTEEQNGDPLLDTDGDGIIDSLDLDADGDGIYDYIEAGHNGVDSDGDGTLDGPFGDDGIPNGVQDNPDSGQVNYKPQDTDGDGVDDFQDIDDDNDGLLTEDENPDPNGDMVPDDAFDSDGDGIPDYLEPNNFDPNAEDDIEVFNAVTPNGDGDHDVLTIANIEKFPDNELNIFNRWGVLVYEARGYGQNGQYFRGESNGRATFNKEKQLPVGTYFYILTYTKNSGENVKRSGYIYINR